VVAGDPGGVRTRLHQKPVAKMSFRPWEGRQ